MTCPQISKKNILLEMVFAIDNASSVLTLSTAFIPCLTSASNSQAAGTTSVDVTMLSNVVNWALPKILMPYSSLVSAGMLFTKMKAKVGKLMNAKVTAINPPYAEYRKIQCDRILHRQFISSVRFKLGN